SNNGSVAAVGALTVVSLVAPNIINRGQTFTLTAVVKNTGGVAVNAIAPVAAPALSGGSATTASNPSIASLAAGASANLAWSYTENGATPGQMSFTLSVKGTNTSTSALVTSPPTSSNLIVVVQPPPVQIESIT